jgi:hypothetical protein
MMRPLEIQPAEYSDFSRAANKLTDGMGSQPMNFFRSAEDEKRLQCYGEAEKLLDLDAHGELLQSAVGSKGRVPDQAYFIPLDFGGMLCRLVRDYTFGTEFRIDPVAKLSGAVSGTASGSVSGNASGSARPSPFEPAQRFPENASGEAVSPFAKKAPEPPKPVELSPEQKTVDWILETNHLVTLGRQVTDTLPALGDAVLRVDVVDQEDELTGKIEPRIRFQYVAPWHYFPDVDPLNTEKVRGVTLAWVVERPNGMEGASKFYVLQERHALIVASGATSPEPGSRATLPKTGTISYSMHDWDGKKLGAPRSAEMLVLFPDLPGGGQVIETGINEIPIVQVGYDRKAGEHWGRSEFKRVARIILALENRLAQLDEVLEKHARPKLIVGPGVLGPDGENRLKDFDVIEIEPSLMEKAVTPQYLTWEMQREAIAHEIEKLEEYFFIMTETSPASFGLERDGSQVESARALKFKAHRTVNKVTNLRDEWTRKLMDLFRIAIKRANVERKKVSLPELATTKIRVQWPDPIVEDEDAEVERYCKLRAEGLVTRVRCLMDLFGLSREEAEKEAEELLQEDVNSAAAQFPPPAMPFGEEDDEEGEGPPKDGETPPFGKKPTPRI